MCYLIYPASKAWRAYSDTTLTLIDSTGAEIAALIADQFFESLDGPVRRVASKDSHEAFSPYLENAILPQSEEIVTVAEELLEY